MVKKLPILFACIAVFALANPALAQQSFTAGWASSAPTLDGTLGDGEWADAAVIDWDAQDAVRPGIVSADSGVVGGPGADGFQDRADSSAVVRVMNDATNLYISIDATDDILDFSFGDVWRNDGAEIRVDGNFSRSAEKENDALGHSAAIRGDGGATTNIPDGAGIETAAAAKADGSGWVIEFLQPIAGFAPTVGFDVAVNDSDDPGNESRDSQYRWNGATDGGWNDESQWGELTLATEPNPGAQQVFASGMASAPPTLDGAIGDGEWADALAISLTSHDAVRPGVVSADSGVVGGPNGDGFQLHADANATVLVMNDGSNLYVAIDANDDILDFSFSDVWRNDGAEIRVDGNFSQLAEKENDALGHSAAIRGDGGATTNIPDGAGIQTAAAAKPDGSGWVIEFLQPIAGFSPTIGFDVAVNDSDDPGNESRDAQYRINGINDGGWNNEGHWAELQLAGASAVETTWEVYE